MGSPWLVGQIEAAFMSRPIPSTPDSVAKLHLAKEQLHDLVSAKGSHGLLIARKHMSWTCTGFPGASQLRHALMRAPTPNDAYQLLDNAIDELGRARRPQEEK
jgi:tRNA-dihydrouridine synthase